MKKKFLCFGLAVLLSMASAFAQVGGETGPLTWVLEDGTLTISGEGEMPGYSHDAPMNWNPAPWYVYRASIHTVVIESGVTRIGNCAFYYCGNLASITIPNSVTSIGSFAFADCYILTSITIPTTVKTIGWAAFPGSNLVSITLPDGITRIESSMFYLCRNLTSIIIPNSVTFIGRHAFFVCKSLTSIIIPNGVTFIEEHAFNGCESLTSVIIPSSMTSIEEGTFNYCPNLTSVIIPSSVTRIEDIAFRNCTSLTLITNLNPVPVAINSNVFQNVNKAACTLEVPIGSVAAYQNANVWKEFNIVGIEVGIEEWRIENLSKSNGWGNTSYKLRVTSYEY
ncbi:MAG: leucine-rich repeat domain-containing protein [Bacteroidales bacterium]|nr:leucine-rich repeat domain-containing protein [Bacteroidales bacterium]